MIEIEEDNVKSIKNPQSLLKQAVYIDDPFIVDDSLYLSRKIHMLNRYNTRGTDHRGLLAIQLQEDSDEDLIEQIVVDKKINKIFDKINNVAEGELVKDRGRNFAYKQDGADDFIKIRNISSGLKTFLIIKKLLQNGTLEENGTLILDEPEIHLHPEWQVILAELIVLIQKEFGMHILLTTHSPYFLYAIEVFTGKYGMKETTSYYLSELDKQDITFSDVTKEIDKIYKKLSDPFQNLENMSYE